MSANAAGFGAAAAAFSACNDADVRTKDECDAGPADDENDDDDDNEDEELFDDAKDAEGDE